MTKRRTALVIDPGQEINEQLSQVLHPSEWRIHEVPNNGAAFDLLKSSRVDLIITSETTSGKDGVELLRSIRRLHRHTRMVILTDQSTPIDVLAAMQERAFSYFSRPFSQPALAAMLRSAAEEPCWDDGIEVLSSGPFSFRVIARCDVKTANRLLQFVREMFDLPNSEKEPVALALRKLLTNVIEYGANFDPDQYVELAYLRAKREVACRITDLGKIFSVDHVSHAALSNPPTDPPRHVGHPEPPGGFGLLLSRNIVDELIYSNKGNEVVLVKYIDAVSRTLELQDTLGPE